ncbi:MAG: hypothetical protein H7839_02505 [Magnetococcus sp. YQC-5]
MTVRAFMIQQAILRKCAQDATKQMGHLHHRLGQTLEHVVPGFSGPTVRRRKELGLNDQYMSALCRWVHRDLVMLATEYMHCDYPYSTLPLTVQFWDYEQTSRHLPLMTSQGYQDWRSSILTNRRSLSHSRHSHASSAQSEDKKHEAQRTVVVQQGYWMLERSALHPILGHELAHNLIHTALGNLNVQVIALEKTGHLGKWARQITLVLDRGLFDRRAMDPLREDILCDLLSASRFAYAFAYAWFLEMMGSMFGDGLNYTDEFGHPESDWQEILCKAQSPRFNPDAENEVPEDYLRGRALLAWLDAMEIKCSDIFAISLHKAIALHLDMLLETRFQGNPDRLASWKSLGDDLQRVITRNARFGPKKASDFLACMMEEKEPTGKDVFKWALWRQKLSGHLREKVKQHLFNAAVKADVGSDEWKLPFLWSKKIPTTKALEWLESMRKHSVDFNVKSNCYNHKKIFDEQYLDLFDLPVRDVSDISWRLEWVCADDSFCTTYAMEEYLFQVLLLSRLIPDTTKSDGLPLPSQMLDIHALQSRWRQSAEAILEPSMYSYYESHAVLGKHPFGDIMSGIHLNPDPKNIHDWYDKDYQNYYMDLLIHADADVGLGSQLDLEMSDLNNKHNILSCLTFGSYNWIVLRKYDGIYFLPETFSLNDSTMALYSIKDDKNKLRPYYDRRRLLRKLYINNGVRGKTDSSNVWAEKIQFIVLVGLRFSGTRPIFLNWFKSRIIDCSSAHPWCQKLFKSTMALFRSSGWEDFVFFLKPEELETGFELIQKLYDHPLVERTHVIYTHAVMDELDPLLDTNKIIIRYEVRVNNSTKDFMNEFELLRPKLLFQWNSTLSSSQKVLDVALISGKMDYSITVSRLTTAEHETLWLELQKMVSVARVERIIQYKIEKGTGASESMVLHTDIR